MFLNGFHTLLSPTLKFFGTPIKWCFFVATNQKIADQCWKNHLHTTTQVFSLVLWTQQTFKVLLWFCTLAVSVLSLFSGKYWEEKFGLKSVPILLCENLCVCVCLQKKVCACPLQLIKSQRGKKKIRQAGKCTAKFFVIVILHTFRVLASQNYKKLLLMSVLLCYWHCMHTVPAAKQQLLYK